MYTISNNPKYPTISRKVDIMEVVERQKGTYIEYACKVHNYDADGEEDADFERKIVKLRADNTTILDKTTGQIADETTPEENQIGEYDFFKTQNVFAIYNIESFAQLDAAIIARADAQKRFD